MNYWSIKASESGASEAQEVKWAVQVAGWTPELLPATNRSVLGPNFQIRRMCKML